MVWGRSHQVVFHPAAAQIMPWGNPGGLTQANTEDPELLCAESAPGLLSSPTTSPTLPQTFASAFALKFSGCSASPAEGCSLRPRTGQGDDPPLCLALHRFMDHPSVLMQCSHQ